MLWSKDVLEVNPQCRVRVDYVGHAKAKVVLADDFYAHPELVGRLALNLYYTDTPNLGGSDPGSRALVTLDTGPLLATLSEMWGEPLRPHFSAYHPVIFSAITNKNYPLTVWQRQPNIDQGVTAMMYLNPEGMCAGGTGLYRHRPTDLERIPIGPTPEFLEVARRHGFPPDRLKGDEGYAEFLNTAILKPEYAAPENQYINDGNDFWELLYLIDMKPNRLVIFDGRMFHSQHIKPGEFVDYYRINQILSFQGHD